MHKIEACLKWKSIFTIDIQSCLLLRLSMFCSTCPRPPTIPTNNSKLAIYSSNFRFLNLKVFMSKFSDRKAFLQCPFYCFIVGRWYQVIVPIYLITYKTVTQPFIATRHSPYYRTLYTQSTLINDPDKIYADIWQLKSKIVFNLVDLYKVLILFQIGYF